MTEEMKLVVARNVDLKFKNDHVQLSMFCKDKEEAEKLFNELGIQIDRGGINLRFYMNVQ